ncbi:MAG: hypothetical protein WC483_04470 [Candidatus Paceibacterota bacterium]|jgi:hypothetical protein
MSTKIEVFKSIESLVKETAKLLNSTEDVAYQKLWRDNPGQMAILKIAYSEATGDSVIIKSNQEWQREATETIVTKNSTKNTIYNAMIDIAKEYKKDGMSEEKAFAKAMEIDPIMSDLYQKYETALPEQEIEAELESIKKTNTEILIEKRAEDIKKANPGLTFEQSMAQAWKENPDLYSKYEAETYYRTWQ